jgi:hypothetical protein
MKFIVIVNQKYLVTVEANTHGGAEHVILDTVYYGIKTCQAFTVDEIVTDTFKALAENCETISYAEMLEKSKLYKETLNNLEQAKRVAEKEKTQIEELQNASGWVRFLFQAFKNPIRQMNFGGRMDVIVLA